MDDHLEVDIRGEEVDPVGANDELGHYHRVWEGDPTSWVGYYRPVMSGRATQSG